MTLTPPCGECSWEIDVPGSEDDAERALAKHKNVRHGAPDPWASSTPPRRRSDMDWRTQAIDALIQLARSRATFTIYEVTEFGCPDPPADHEHAWGKFTADAKQLELIRKVGGAPSKRPGTKGSMTGMWTAGPAIIAGLRPSRSNTA